MHNLLISRLLFGLIFILVIVPLGWLVRRNDPLQLRKRADGSYLRMLSQPLQSGHAQDKTDFAHKT